MSQITKMIAFFPICFGQYVVAAAAAMYQEQVLSYKYLDESLDEGRFVFECILAGTLQAFITCS